MTEWTEEVVFGSRRVRRGGAHNTGEMTLCAACRDDADSPSFPGSNVGFRVVELAGPAIPAASDWTMVVMTLLVLAAGTLFCARRAATAA